MGRYALGGAADTLGSPGAGLIVCYIYGIRAETIGAQQADKYGTISAGGVIDLYCAEILASGVVYLVKTGGGGLCFLCFHSVIPLFCLCGAVCFAVSRSYLLPLLGYYVQRLGVVLFSLLYYTAQCA